LIVIESFVAPDASLVDLCEIWRLSQLHFLYTSGVKLDVGRMQAHCAVHHVQAEAALACPLRRP
jgi:hypothetical protein